MRWGFWLLALVALVSCIPRGTRPPSRPPAAGPAGPDPAVVRQCHVELAAAEVGFRVLPDRRFDNGCSALGAVQLLEIGTPVTNLGAMTCPLARQFARWVRDSVQPAAVRHFGTLVRRIESFGSYGCRSVNSRPGARLSEHAFANAVDIAAFQLEGGRRISVADHWNGDDEEARRFLRDIHRAGCRLFQVGLGPEADAFHRDHLHFDLGRGPYCR